MKSCRIPGESVRLSVHPSSPRPFRGLAQATQRLAQASQRHAQAYQRPELSIETALRCLGQPLKGLGQPLRGLGQPLSGLGQPLSGLGQASEGPGGRTDVRTYVQTYRFPLYSTELRPLRFPPGPMPKKGRKRIILTRSWKSTYSNCCQLITYVLPSQSPQPWPMGSHSAHQNPSIIHPSQSN